MANYPVKHEFVDDYPYLAYASEVDTIAGDGEGGGEGGGSEYVLPVASADTLGGVKIGDGLGIDSVGTLNVTNLMLQVTHDTANDKYVLDHTFDEIKTAFATGGKVFIFDNNIVLPGAVKKSYILMEGMFIENDGGGVVGFSNTMTFEANSDSDYPVLMVPGNGNGD